ncbi:MAG: hypothetical protein MR283_06985 [Erysipelotrichaceae bacterium]|nr:hypothetical protein [Erysipelotrichaceae bacterium]MDY6035579.1 hypothetical protein [Bulleidia sp.]
MKQLYKRYVDVVVVQKKTGELRPLYLFWNDGKSYKIDRVVSHGRRASCVGGCGMRFVCIIQGRCRNLYLEKDRWFVESYQP